VRPPIHYARSGDVNIAYSTIGEGPDLVIVAGWVSNIAAFWDNPLIAHFLERLSRFSRLILFDKRGTGLSDRNTKPPTLEERMDDVRAVMDAAGSERAALFGYSEGGSLCTLFAATYPERTRALILFGTFAKRVWSPDYPWAPTPEQRQKFFNQIADGWAADQDLYTIAPSIAADPVQRRLWADYCRMSASPAAALDLAKLNTQIDVRHVLPTIRVPTLVMHRTGDLDASVDEGRWIASQMPGGKFVELPGDDHVPFVGDSDAIIDEVQNLITGERPKPEMHRMLATVLFTDIVGSTPMAEKMGDHAWRGVLDRHDRIIVHAVDKYRGRLVKDTGDGALAVFDGPARAVRCAQEIQSSLKHFGLDVRAGVHCGEIELMDDDIAGLAVNIASRICSDAGPGEVLVSSTVRDLTSGSGLVLSDLGERKLAGVSQPWRIFSVSN